MNFPVVNLRKSLGQSGCDYWKDGMDKAAKKIADLNSIFTQNPSYANNAGAWNSFQDAQQEWNYYKNGYDDCVRNAGAYPFQYNPYGSFPTPAQPPNPPPVPTGPTSGPERKPVETSSTQNTPVAPVATGGPDSCGPGQFWDGTRCRSSVSSPGAFGGMALGPSGTISAQAMSFPGASEGFSALMGARFPVMNVAKHPHY